MRAILGPEVQVLELAGQSGLSRAQRAGDALDVVQSAGGADGLGRSLADVLLP